jgi:hypothetical protein
MLQQISLWASTNDGDSFDIKFGWRVEHSIEGLRIEAAKKGEA